MPAELQLHRLLVLLQHLQVQNTVQRMLMPERMLPLLHAAQVAVRRTDHAMPLLNVRQPGRLRSWQLATVVIIGGVTLTAAAAAAGPGAGLVRVLGLTGLSLLVGACSVASP